MSTKRRKFDAVSAAVLAATLCGGAIRFAYVVWLPGQNGDLIHSDMSAYESSGRAMAHGEPISGIVGFNGYHPLSSSTYYHVGYTWFVALIYVLAGDVHARLALRLTQAAISTATIPLVYAVARQVFNRPAGAFAAWLTAAYLPLAYYCGLMLTETWFTFLQMAAVSLWLAALQRNSRSRAIAAGAVAGLACTVRTAFIPGVGVWALAALWTLPKYPLRVRMQIGVVMLLAAGAVITPVTFRNYQIHGRFIPLSTNGPATFYTGHVTHTFANAGFAPTENDADVAERLRERNWDYVRSNWRAYLEEIPEFYSNIWLTSDFWPAQTINWAYVPLDNEKHEGRIRIVSDEPGGPKFGHVNYFPDLMRYDDQLLWILLAVPAALLAPLLPRAKAVFPSVLYLTLVPYLIVPWIAPPFARYRIPACPIVFVLAGQTIAVVGQWIRQARQNDRKCDSVSP